MHTHTYTLIDWLMGWLIDASGTQFDLDIFHTYVADSDSYTCMKWRMYFFPMSIYSHKANLVLVQWYQWANMLPEVPNSWLTQVTKVPLSGSGRRLNLRPGTGSDVPGIWLNIFCRSSGKQAKSYSSWFLPTVMLNGFHHWSKAFPERPPAVTQTHSCALESRNVRAIRIERS